MSSKKDCKNKKIGNRNLRPESLMMSYGYNPEWSEYAIKSPIFQTSTFVFKSAEEGKSFFEVAYGLREKEQDEQLGLIYSRLNNPDLEILEDRLTLWDDAEDAAVFESGMAAISTTLMEFLKPGQVLLHSQPVYGGTDYFVNNVLEKFNIKAIGFNPGMSFEDIVSLVEQNNLSNQIGAVFIETPGNPTNCLIDIEMCSRLAKHFSNEENEVVTIVDNTFLGPVYQHPLKHGADLVIYSATKFIGGHSDVIAGACLGGKELIARVKGLRTFMGSMGGPWTGWLLMRSLETLKIRMDKQSENAQKVADFLRDHDKVEQVYYLGHLKEGDRDFKVYNKQCLGSGSMISFDIVGGEKEAFRFLNNLQLFHLAVSLGSTESLAEHPASMTHSDISPELQLEYGISPQMVRLSIGVENSADLIEDINTALEL